MLQDIKVYKEKIEEIADKLDVLGYEEYESIIDRLDSAVASLRHAKTGLERKVNG